jgi:hypothetical protein
VTRERLFLIQGEWRAKFIKREEKKKVGLWGWQAGGKINQYNLGKELTKVEHALVR